MNLIKVTRSGTDPRINMKINLLLATSAAALCAFTLLPTRVHATALAYSVSDLGTLPGDTTSSANGINASGAVVGNSYTQNGSTNHAVVWTDTTPTALGTHIGYFEPESGAFGISDLGQIVGYTKVWNANATQATVWTGTTVTGGLGGSTPPPYAAGELYRSGLVINAAGQIAGNSTFTLNGGLSRFTVGMVWSGGTANMLNHPSGIPYYNTYLSSFAVGINNTGQVAGYATIDYDSNQHAVRWNGVTPTDLGTIGGTNSEAYGINASGQVAGYSFTAGNSAYHAVRWTGTTAEDLGTLGGTRSQGYGINDSGDVIGMSFTTDNVANLAFLYTGGTMYSLNSLLLPGSGVSDLSISGAGTINDSGQIAAIGTINGQTHALRLTPVPTPEPSSALLLLGSVGLLAGFRRFGYTNQT